MIARVRLRTKFDGFDALRPLGFGQDGGQSGGLQRRQIAGVHVEN